MGQRISDVAFKGGNRIMHIDRREKMIILATVIMVVVFALALAVSSIAYGIQVPLPEMRVNPQIVLTPGSYAPGETASHFSDPEEERFFELPPDGSNNYAAYIVARAWSYSPREIRVPAGSTVSFYLTSVDVQHGFKVQGTNINMMILPGQVSTLKATFDEPGEFFYICHEYCGINHHIMWGKVIVE
jgi:cytochrome c oxidase subunit 2